MTTTIRYGMLRRDFGHWKTAEFTIGRNQGHPGWHGGNRYAVATARFGPYPLLQLHAWMNNEGDFGAYWQVGKGGLRDRLQALISVLGRSNHGTYERPSMRGYGPGIRLGPGR